MDRYTQHVKESLTRGEGWLDGNPSYFSAEPPEVARALSVHRDALHGVNVRLTEHIMQHETCAVRALLIAQDEREQRRDLLSHHMATIVKTARALRGEVPGIGVLQMPKGAVHSAALITAAEVMVRKAEIYRQVLVDNGLPSDFLQQLTAAAGRLKASLDARGLARAAQRAAVAGITTEVALGRRVVSLIDSALKRVLRREPVKWAEWRHATRVRRPGFMPKDAATRDEQQPTVAGTAATVAGTAPTAVVVAATGVVRAATAAESDPSLVQASPTEVVGSSTVREKAA
jgi:hypothetical protein